MYVFALSHNPSDFCSRCFRKFIEHPKLGADFKLRRTCMMHMDAYTLPAVHALMLFLRQWSLTCNIIDLPLVVQVLI